MRKNIWRRSPSTVISPSSLYTPAVKSIADDFFEFDLYNSQSGNVTWSFLQGFSVFNTNGLYNPLFAGHYWVAAISNETIRPSQQALFTATGKSDVVASAGWGFVVMGLLPKDLYPSSPATLRSDMICSIHMAGDNVVEARQRGYNYWTEWTRTTPAGLKPTLKVGFDGNGRAILWEGTQSFQFPREPLYNVDFAEQEYYLAFLTISENATEEQGVENVTYSITGTASGDTVPPSLVYYLRGR